MKSASVGPLSRPLPLGRITPGGIDVVVEASETERAALATDLDCPAIHELRGLFRVAGDVERVRVTGRVRARLDRVCVITLDPFTTEVDEDVDVTFVAGSQAATDIADEVEIRDDMPDELQGDMVDLGAITAEFLALGLDPYPRKPGAAFEAAEEGAPDSPFASLARLRSVKD